MQTILSDFERRVVGNLSIPRNLADLTHELRRDPYLVDVEGKPLVPTEKMVRSVLDDVLAEGFVVNLGNGLDQTPGHLAALVDRHKQAVSMPDEKARIFELRLGKRLHRLDGDVFHFTNSGFEKLHEPVSPSPVLPLEQVQAMVDAHFAAIKDVPFSGSIFDAEGGLLVDPPRGFSLAKGTTKDGERVATLLPEEFMAWLGSVKEYADAHYPGSLRVPIAGGQPGWGNADEDLLINAENGGTAYGITAPWYLALTTVAVTDTDTGSTITEATGATGYARKSVAQADMGGSSGGVSANANAVVFAGITAGTATVIGFSKTTASSAGRNVKYGTCASTVISTTQTPPQFAVGALTTSAD
jgi:hypothetical protein